MKWHVKKKRRKINIKRVEAWEIVAAGGDGWVGDGWVLGQRATDSD